MEAEQFLKWLKRMKREDRIATDRDAARALGVTPNGILVLKKNGTDLRTALACAALLAGLKPYK